MLSKNKYPHSIPEEFKKYFWDVSLDELSFEKHLRFITERFLNYGDLQAIKWIFSCTTKESIKSIVKTSRNLNVKTKNYWQIMLP